MSFKFSDLLAEANGEKPVTFVSDTNEEAASASQEHEPTTKLEPSTPTQQPLLPSTSDSTRQSEPDNMSGNKRASAYKHGQPGREFEERPEDEPEVPVKATAAQLAARK